MKFSVLGALAAALLCSTLAARAEPLFNRIASFPVNTNLPADIDQKTETSAEIISVTADGNMLVYSDSPLGAIGMIDITDPVNPKPHGIVRIDGEPTSVTVAHGKALVGVNTSASYTEPSGLLAVIDIATKTVEATCDLGGQPDSVGLSPSGDLLAIAIENERDEDLNDGEMPQMPAGFLVLLKMKDGVPDCAGKVVVDMTGLAEVAPEDPEPEFVDINDRNEVVVTLQENNHIVVVDGNTGKVISHFSAGKVDLDNVDTAEEGALTFDGTLKGVAREPDAVQWLDDDRIVIANEGDYKGGSRGFTIFSKTGEVLYDSGLDFEYRIAMAGQYPEKRSGNKGVEPEGLEVKRFGDTNYIFVLSERSSIVGVYKDTGGKPEFVQLLPTAVAPEGAVAIPGRDLLAVSNEADLVEENGLRSHVTIYKRGEGPATYPMIVSSMDANGRPVGFGALSGLAADASVPGRLYAVNDSFYRMQPTIFTIDATKKPAEIINALPVTRDGAPAQLLDLEGIVVDGKGGFWVASEGRSDKQVPHALYHVDSKGAINQALSFPPELIVHETRFGAEGVTLIGDTLWVAIQRPWKDDPKDAVKLVAYNTKTKEWGAVRYPLDKAEKGWVGLSEISLFGDYVYIIERDNQIGANAKIKKLYRVAVSDLVPAPLGGDLPMVAKEEVRDFIPDLKSTGGYVVDKIEGFTIDTAGTGYAVTDNDGVDDSNGETLFFSTGKM
ncbi:esterase-like activity of phytase family protein [Stappia sp.]|uniref:esterase-like activity of phytase family protein n=1 Tax=Stappia sp. TaxID=1870903 RepID=UPI003A99CE8F